MRHSLVAADRGSSNDALLLKCPRDSLRTRHWDTPQKQRTRSTHRPRSDVQTEDTPKKRLSPTFVTYKKEALSHAYKNQSVHQPEGPEDLVWLGKRKREPAERKPSMRCAALARARRSAARALGRPRARFSRSADPLTPRALKPPPALRAEAPLPSPSRASLRRAPRHQPWQSRPAQRRASALRPNHLHFIHNRSGREVR